MTQSDLILFAAVAVLASNHALLRIPGWVERVWLFWLVQLLNLGAACYLIVMGIPEFRGTMAIANWMFGLLFIYHTVSNNRRLQRAMKAGRQRSAADEEEHRARIRAAIKAGEE